MDIYPNLNANEWACMHLIFTSEVIYPCGDMLHCRPRSSRSRLAVKACKSLAGGVRRVQFPQKESETTLLVEMADHFWQRLLKGEAEAAWQPFLRTFGRIAPVKRVPNGLPRGVANVIQMHFSGLQTTRRGRFAELYEISGELGMNYSTVSGFAKQYAETMLSDG